MNIITELCLIEFVVLAIIILTFLSFYINLVFGLAIVISECFIFYIRILQKLYPNKK